MKLKMSTLFQVMVIAFAVTISSYCIPRRHHLTDKVKTSVAALRTDTCVIPGGLMSHLQPVDVLWNKPFKNAYKDLYNEWLSSGEKSFTASGNMKAPGKLLCLEWVKKVWNTVTTDVIVNSFRACGISRSMDGSDDSSIQCLKRGGVAH